MSVRKLLSIDGGGIRAIIPAMVLAEIEKRTGQPISELFDLITGTSSGGVLALGLVRPGPDGSPKYTARDGVDLFSTQGEQIFSRSLLHRVRSVWSVEQEKYQSEGIESVFQKYFADARLSDALTDVLITGYDIERRKPYFFKSAVAKQGDEPGHDAPMWQVARATSAAPTYFEPCKIPIDGTSEYRAIVDAGIFANNPGMCALAEARVLHPDDEYLLASLGTGELTRPLKYHDAKDWGMRQWAQPIIGISFDGTSSTVDYQLKQALSSESYVRIQTMLVGSNDDLDDASPTNIRAVQSLAESVIAENDQNLDDLCSKLVD